MSATNAIATFTNVAREALILLENELVLGKLVNRGYEDEFNKNHNGYKQGNTVKVRRPAKYPWRSGRVAVPANSTDKTFDLVVDVQGGVDLQFNSADLTLSVTDFNEKYLKSAMATVASQVDNAIALEAYRSTWNLVGTPGQLIDAYSDFGKAAQRLDEMAVPKNERVGVLSPADTWALVPTLAGTYVDGVNKTALTKAKIPMLGNIDLYSSNAVVTHTVGPLGGTPLINGGAQGTTYAASGALNAQSLITDGWTAAAAARVKRGDVFTIVGVYAINPMNKQTLPYLQQFVVNADGSSDGSGNLTMNISPAIIVSGAYQTVSAVPADNVALTFVGTAGVAYNQNLVFNPKAYALTMVPMEKPEGAVKCAVETHKGLSVRLIPYYDGPNDESNWRLDVLFGVKGVYPDLATRAYGT